jgi:hypothetical protein
MVWLLLLLLKWSLFTLFLSWFLFGSDPSLSLMWKIYFLIVSYVRMFTRVHHLGILFMRVWFVTLIAPFMAWSRLLGLGFRVFASVVTAAGFSINAHDPAFFVHVSPRGRTLLLLYVWWGLVPRVPSRMDSKGPRRDPLWPDPPSRRFKRTMVCFSRYR